MIETQNMLVKAICRGFFLYNFSKNPGGEVLLKWGNGGKILDGVSRPAITRRAKKIHEEKIEDIKLQMTINSAK